MKLYGVDIPRTNRKQKNQFDGKLYLVDRHFLCQRRFSGIDPRVAQHVLMPAGTFLLSGSGRSLESQSLPALSNKLCRYGSGVAFLSLFQTKNGTNGISISRMAETNVCMATAITTGARENIVQNSGNDGGSSKRYVTEYWMSRTKEYSNTEAPNYVY